MLISLIEDAPYDELGSSVHRSAGARAAGGLGDAFSVEPLQRRQPLKLALRLNFRFDISVEVS